MDITNIDPSTSIVRYFGSKIISSYRERKRNELLEALSNEKILLDSHQLKSDEFISAYLATEDAIIKASSKRKFNFLLSLFINGCNSGRIEKYPDAYQEVLSIVDELSERELTILYHLYSYERDHKDTDGGDSEHQINYLIKKTYLERDLIVALLVRLRRTGLLISRSEKSSLRDLALSGMEVMCISRIAEEVKAWVFHVIEGSFTRKIE